MKRGYVKDYFEASFLLCFINMKFPDSLIIPDFELFHYVSIINGAFGLDFNLVIIYNFHFTVANGDFF